VLVIRAELKVSVVPALDPTTARSIAVKSADASTKGKSPIPVFVVAIEHKEIAVVSSALGQAMYYRCFRTRNSWPRSIRERCFTDRTHNECSASCISQAVSVS